MTKLEERMKEYGIPPLEELPQGKKVLIYRIPAVTHTAGGLEIPEEHRDPALKGVLMAAGLKARDTMKDALFEIGDIVRLPVITTMTPEIQRSAGAAGKHMVILNVEDIVTSLDGAKRLAAEYRIAYDEENGEHFYEKRDADHTRARRKKAA